MDFSKFSLATQIPLADEIARQFLDKLVLYGGKLLPYLTKFISQLFNTLISPEHLLKQVVAVIILQTTLTSFRSLARVLKRIVSSFSAKGRKERELMDKLEEVSSFSDWKVISSQLDIVRGEDKWRDVAESPLYDFETLDKRTNEMVSMLEKKHVFDLIFRLRGGLSRNQYGIGHEGLFSRALCGTKRSVEEYLGTVTGALGYICDSHDQDEHGDPLTTETKLGFFNEVRHSFGRTALLLSGGASLGYYHLGVIKALFEQKLLPRVVSGASAGSLMASVVGTQTDDELMHVIAGGGMRTDFFRFANESAIHSFHKKFQFLIPIGFRWMSEMLISLFLDTSSVLRMDTSHFKEVVAHNTGPYTFQEAFDRTGRILNITVAPRNKYDPPRLLNYLTAPHVLVWSAAVASCAVPGIFEATSLLVKDADGAVHVEKMDETEKFSDGSLEADLPIQQLSELFNVNHFIISQVNPHASFFSKFTITSSIWSPLPFRFLTSTLHFLKSQIIDWVKNMVDFLFLRKKGAALTLTQDYDGRDGDIIVFPWRGHVSTLSSFLFLLVNPDADQYDSIMMHAERTMYPLIKKIKAHCQIEMCLENCVQTLRKRLLMEERQQIAHMKGKSVRMGKRVPSFYTSPSLVNLSGLSVLDHHHHEEDESPEKREQRSTSVVKKRGISRLFPTVEDDEKEKSSEGYEEMVIVDNEGDEEELSKEEEEELEDHNPNMMKSSSMANFYYRRQNSSSNSLSDLGMIYEEEGGKRSKDQESPRSDPEKRNSSFW